MTANMTMTAWLADDNGGIHVDDPEYGFDGEGDGQRIGLPSSEEWEPKVYDAALRCGGYVRVSEWRQYLGRHMCDVTRA